ncbi:Ig-like domain-containing protein, partial [Staphylococcus xylosus]|uniref:Ig-like domain-containing protein n=12 Tax=Staphylococcus xylosus TaxID=1288 RepID=UPI001D16D68F
MGNKKSKMFPEKRVKRFSIRKLKAQVGSVAIGTLIFLSSMAVADASEKVVDKDNDVQQSVTQTENERVANSTDTAKVDSTSTKESETPENQVAEEDTSNATKESETPENQVTEEDTSNATKESETPENQVTEEDTSNATKESETPENQVTEEDTSNATKESETPENEMNEVVKQFSSENNISADDQKLIEKELPDNTNELSNEELKTEIVKILLEKEANEGLPNVVLNNRIPSTSRFRSISTFAASTTSTNVNDLVKVSNLKIEVGDPKDPSNTTIIRPTSGGYYTVKGDYTVDDKVKAGDTFTINWGDYILPGSLRTERTPPVFQSSDGQAIAVGKYNADSNSTEYIFTDYVNKYNNVKGSFNIIATTNRSTVTTNNQSYNNTINFAGETLNYNVIADYRNYSDTQQVWSAVIATDSNQNYTRVSYVNPKFTKNTKTSNTVLLETTGAIDNDIKIYKVPNSKASAFTDSFLPNLDGLEDVTNQVSISKKGPTNVLSFDKNNLFNQTGYIIIQKGQATSSNTSASFYTRYNRTSAGNSIGQVGGSTDGSGDFSSVSESASQSLSESQSLSNSNSISQSQSLSTSESISESESLSTSESISESESLSTSESISESESLSTSESISESESLSTSESISESESLSTSESISESESLSTSESISESESLSTSESISESESLSTSESISESESLSTSESISESESLST